MAKKPLEWIAFPLIHTSKEELLAVEQAIVRRLQPSLNIVWNDHVRRSKRKRPPKYLRPRKPLSGIDLPGTVATPLTFTTFTDGDRVRFDLFHLVSTAQPGAIIRCNAGSLDATRTTPLATLLRSSKLFLLVEGRCTPVQNLWSLSRVLRKNTGTRLLVQQVVSCAALTASLHDFTRRRGLAGRLRVLSTDEKWNLWLHRKLLPSALRQKLLRALVPSLRGSVGFSPQIRLTVKLPFSESWNIPAIRQRLYDLIEPLKAPRAFKRELMRKTRIVFQKGETIASILCNHIPTSKQLTFEEQCSCKGVCNPVQRFSDTPDPYIRRLAVNAKYIPTPAAFSPSHVLTAAVNLSLFTAGLHVRLRPSAAHGTFNAQSPRQTEISAIQVHQAKELLGNRVICPLDHNIGALVHLCPATYSRDVKKLFDWTTPSACYALSMESEKNLLQQWIDVAKQKGWTKIARSNTTTAGFPYGYALPKDKDVSRYRPIVSCRNHPLARLFNLVARGLMMLLHSPYIRQFTIHTVEEFTTRVVAINEVIPEDHDALFLPGDIKNMFTNVPHKAALKAVTFVVWSAYADSKMVHVRRKGRGHAYAGMAPNPNTHAFFRKDQVVDIIAFYLENSFFSVGNVVLRQVWGVPMGGPPSPAIAICLCAYAEHQFLSSIDTWKFFGLRYVDDTFLVGIYPRNDEAAREKMISLLERATTIYHKQMTVETEELGTRAKFLESSITYTNHKLHTQYHNKNLETMLSQAKQKVIRFVPFGSYGPRRQKELTVYNALHRIKNTTPDNLDIISAAFAVAHEFLLLRYPRRLLRRILWKMTHRTGNPAWFAASLLLSF